MVFCDWLDVTFPPHSLALSRISSHFDQLGFVVLFSESGVSVLVPVQKTETTPILVEGVKVRLERSKLFHKISLSGSALRHLRATGAFGTLLYLISEFPHTITRLDAALDVPLDFPKVLAKLRKRFPDGFVSLTRKKLRVKTLLAQRVSDGVETGTYYVGHKASAKVTARVYDKTEESLARRGEVLPTTTRIELTFRKEMKCTLQDAYMPESLFYGYAKPLLFTEVPPVDSWVSHGDGWKSEVAPPREMTLADLEARLELSPEFQRLRDLADQFGEVGRVLLARRVCTSLDVPESQIPSIANRKNC